MTIEEIVQRARAAHKAGVVAIQGRFGIAVINGFIEAHNPSIGCCGIGLAMIGLNTGRSTGRIESIPTHVMGVLLDISRLDMESFTKGFDGCLISIQFQDEWYRAGRELAKEFGLRVASNPHPHSS